MWHMTTFSSLNELLAKLNDTAGSGAAKLDPETNHVTILQPNILLQSWTLIWYVGA